MWFLRAWKIGQLEALAAEKKESLSKIDSVRVDQSQIKRIISASSRKQRSSFIGRMMKWKKV